MHDVYRDCESYGYLGLENIENLVKELAITTDNIPEDINQKYELFNELGFFIGKNTLEVDMMNEAYQNNDATNVFCEIFNRLTNGGEKQKENFKKEILNREYWTCLKKIEGNGIGKGRFAQAITPRILENHIPQYIKDAIEYIFKKVENY